MDELVGNSNDSVSNLLAYEISSLVVMVISSSGGGHLVKSCTFNITPLIC